MAQLVTILFGHGYHPGHEYEVFLLLSGVAVAFLAQFKIFHYIKALFSHKKDKPLQKENNMVEKGH